MIVHEKVHDQVVERLAKAYGSIIKRLGDPLDDGTLYGPMHSKVGLQGYQKTLAEVKELGGKIEFGGNVVEREGNYVEPTIVTGLAHDASGNLNTVYPVQDPFTLSAMEINNFR